MKWLILCAAGILHAGGAQAQDAVLDRFMRTFDRCGEKITAEAAEMHVGCVTEIRPNVTRRIFIAAGYMAGDRRPPAEVIKGLDEYKLAVNDVIEKGQSIERAVIRRGEGPLPGDSDSFTMSLLYKYATWLANPWEVNETIAINYMNEVWMISITANFDCSTEATNYKCPADLVADAQPLLEATQPFRAEVLALFGR